MYWKKLFQGALNGLMSNPLQSIGSILGSVMSIGSARREQRITQENMRYQDKINDENYSKQLADQRQMIQEDREYNSIGQQMRRAKEANISPLAALGVSSGNSLSASTPSHGSVSPSGPSRDSAASLMTSLQGMAQMQMIQKQQEKMDVEMATERLRQVEQTYENIIKQIEAEGYSEKFAEEINQLKASVRRLSTQAKLDDTEIQFNLDSMDSRLREATNKADLVGEQTKTQRASTDYYNAMVADRNAFRQLEVELRKSDINLKDQQRDRLANLMFVDDALVDKYKQDTRLSEKQRDYVTSQIGKIAKEREKMDAEIANINGRTNLQSSEKQKMISSTVANYIKSAVMISNEIRGWFGITNTNAASTNNGYMNELMTDLAIGAIL